jgi:hypothetical protein
MEQHTLALNKTFLNNRTCYNLTAKQAMTQALLYLHLAVEVHVSSGNEEINSARNYFITTCILYGQTRN